MATVISAQSSLGSLPGQPQLHGGALADGGSPRHRAGAPRRRPRRPGRHHQARRGGAAATQLAAAHNPPPRSVRTIETCLSQRNHVCGPAVCKSHGGEEGRPTVARAGMGAGSHLEPWSTTWTEPEGASAQTGGHAVPQKGLGQPGSPSAAPTLGCGGTRGPSLECGPLDASAHWSQVAGGRGHSQRGGTHSFPSYGRRHGAEGTSPEPWSPAARERGQRLRRAWSISPTDMNF